MNIRRHMCVSIAGFLRNAKYPQDFRHFTDDYGRTMNEREAEADLRRHLALGHKVLPAGSCDNFDYQTGCRGHAIKEKVE